MFDLHQRLQWDEEAKLFTRVDFVWEMTAKKSC